MLTAPTHLSSLDKDWYHYIMIIRWVFAVCGSSLTIQIQLDINDDKLSSGRKGRLFHATIIHKNYSFE